MSAAMASRLRRVSYRVSPLLVEEVCTSRLRTSADRRLAASSKVLRVRVEFSKKTLHTVLPRSSGTFLMDRSPTSRKERSEERRVGKGGRTRWGGEHGEREWAGECGVGEGREVR